jgi:hypothetical protein
VRREEEGMMACPGCEWSEAYIGDLLQLIERVKDVLAEVPEAWSELEHAGINFMVPVPYRAAS